MFYYDLHCHSVASKDSIAKIESIVRSAKKRGLTGIAITDHNKTYKGPLEIDGIQIIPANEVTLKDGCHLLAYFVSEDFPKERKSLKDAVAEIKNQGGIAVLAHPYREKNGYAKVHEENEAKIKEALKLVDGIETSNASDSDEEREMAEKLAEKKKLFTTAGSDSHMSGQVAFSVVGVSEKITRDNFEKVLKNKKVFVKEEAGIFRREIRSWKKTAFSVGNFFGFQDSGIMGFVFWDVFVKNYFRIKNKKFKKYSFNFEGNE